MLAAATQTAGGVDLAIAGGTIRVDGISLADLRDDLVLI